MPNEKQETKTLQLKGENKTFKSQDGKTIKYTAMYVEIDGIKIKVQATESVGKQLLNKYFGGGSQ